MTDKEKNTLKKGIVGIFDKFNVLDHSSTIGGLKNDILSFINSMQQEPLRIKEGCRYRCLRNILNTDTGKFSFVKGKIYSSPKNDILIEETGVLCNTSEDSSGFELVEEPESKFEQSIQEGDNIVYNEDLGCRVNLSQLDRVAKKEEPVSEELWEASKQYALRQVLASTDTKMSEQAYLSLKLFSGFEIAVAHKDGANWQKEKFEKNRLKHCDSITNEQAELEQGFIDQHLDKYNRMPTFLDAIEYGMRLQKEQMIAKAVNGTTKFVGEGAEKMVKFVCADLNPDEYGLNQRVKLIIIKEEEV